MLILCWSSPTLAYLPTVKSIPALPASEVHPRSSTLEPLLAAAQARQASSRSPIPQSHKPGSHPANLPCAPLMRNIILPLQLHLLARLLAFMPSLDATRPSSHPANCSHQPSGPPAELAIFSLQLTTLDGTELIAKRSWTTSLASHPAGFAAAGAGV